MKKTLKMLLILTLVFSFFASVTASADPGMVGNSVIKIKKPETYTSTTSQKEYYISGVTQSDVMVSVYRYNPFTERFHLLYVDGKLYDSYRPCRVQVNGTIVNIRVAHNHIGR